jgi:hypothetical protein
MLWDALQVQIDVELEVLLLSMSQVIVRSGELSLLLEPMLSEMMVRCIGLLTIGGKKKDNEPSLT